MTVRAYRPRKPSAAQKAQAHGMYAASAGRPWDALEQDIAELVLAAAPAKAAEQAAHDRMTSPEVQDLITVDSRRAMAEADRQARKHTYKDTAVEEQQRIEPVLRSAPYVAYEPRTDQRRVTAVQDFVRGGNATFTLVSKRTGTRYTFRVRQPDPDKPHFVSLLNGPDNESDYVFLGTIFADGTYRHGKKSSIAYNAPSATAARWFFDNLANPHLNELCEVWHEGRCCRCGRKLTVPSSVESGIGPECAKHEGM